MHPRHRGDHPLDESALAVVRQIIEAVRADPARFKAAGERLDERDSEAAVLARARAKRGQERRKENEGRYWFAVACGDIGNAVSLGCDPVPHPLLERLSFSENDPFDLRLRFDPVESGSEGQPRLLAADEASTGFPYAFEVWWDVIDTLEELRADPPPPSLAERFHMAWHDLFAEPIPLATANRLSDPNEHRDVAEERLLLVWLMLDDARRSVQPITEFQRLVTQRAESAKLPAMYRPDRRGGSAAAEDVPVLAVNPAGVLRGYDPNGEAGWIAKAAAALDAILDDLKHRIEAGVEAVRSADAKAPPEALVSGADPADGGAQDDGKPLASRVEQARDEYLEAAEALKKDQIKDRETYDWHAKEGRPIGVAFSTWTSYLRQWRRAVGQQKAKPRAGRGDAAGRSIAPADQV